MKVVVVGFALIFAWVWGFMSMIHSPKPAHVRQVESIPINHLKAYQEVGWDCEIVKEHSNLESTVLSMEVVCTR